jgi:hypothetical protein
VIDTQTSDSPGWWMARLARKLRDRQRHYQRLQCYAEGNPPLPVGAESCKEAYRAFQKKSRTNFAELIVEAMLDRMSLRAVRTAVENDNDGDTVAMRYVRRNQLHVGLKDTFEWMLTFGRSYMSVGSVEDSIGAPLIKAEDPRQTITAVDPVTGVTRAAFKLFHDDVEDRDLAYLWLPGELHVATRPRRSLKAHVPLFSPGAYTFDDDLGGDWQDKVVPVVEFVNRNAVGEFERHTDVLDRINHMLLQRLVVATFQAFRQRAIKVENAEDMPDRDPETGELIDYNDIFAADPGALWKLPKGADLWESAQTDLTPLLTGVKDDVLHLAAVTRTPLTMFTPDAATQTAEGAQLQREGLVFKVEDREGRATPPLAQVFSLAFTFDPDNRYADVDGARTDRADTDRIGIDWMPADRYSLAERASAATQAESAGIPWETRATDIWQFPPDQVQRMKAQRLDDVLFTQATTVDTPPAEPTPTPPADGGQ